MNVEVLALYKEHFKRDSYDLIVVVDTLRAGTTIARALENGALAVYPVASVEDAFSLGRKIPSVVLAGERRSFKVEGFDLGNSPREFTRERVLGKNIVLTTSNGTQAVEKFKEYGPLVSMSLSNFEAVARYSERFENVLVVCSGSHGEVALEDIYTAGKYVEYFDNPALNDTAIVAKYLTSEEKIKMLKISHHGRYLSKIGMAKDLKEACRKSEIVPVLKKDPLGINFFGGDTI